MNSRLPLTRVLPLLLPVAAAIVTPAPVRAFEVALDASALQLPSDGWFRTNASIGLAVPFGRQFNAIAEGGAALPYLIAGYREQISFGALLGEWRFGGGQGWITPSVAFGAGAYLDQVEDSGGWVPSLVTRAGLRTGGADSRFGFHAQFECYAGIYSTDQLGSYVIWPMSRVIGGIHASF